MAAIYTFSDLHAQVLSWMDEAGDTATTLTNVKAALNQAHQKRLQQEPWPFLLWPDVETLTLSLSTRVYTLHAEFWRPDYFYNRDAKAFLIETPERQIVATGERWASDTGRTPWFRFGAVNPVAAQPTSASVLTLVSSSASDTGGSKAITIYGTASGALTSETLTPTGTTPVVGSTAFQRILGVTKGAAWVGTLTMTSNSGGVTNLTLLPVELGRTYQTIELFRLPTAPDVIEYRFFRQPRKLVLDNDIPDIPYAHAQILVWDALLLMGAYNSDTSPAAMTLWSGYQAEIEADMRRMWLEGRSLEAEPRTVRYIDEEERTPRIFS